MNRDRPVPVRKRVCARHLSAHHRHAQGPGALRLQRRHRRTNSIPFVKADDATDLAYVGEFRHIKGADLLIDAVARLRADGKTVTLTLGGDGEETGTESSGRAARPRRGRALHRPRQGALRLLQGLAAGRALARRFHALCRDRGGRRRHSDGRGQCRRHPRDFRHRTPMRCSRRTSPAPWPTRSRPRSTILQGAQARAKSLRERIFLHFSQKAMVEGVLAGYRDAFANR